MAKKKVYDIIYSAVVKHLRTKQGNVTSLPNNDEIQNGMRKIFRQLKDGGYNPVSADKVIKTESDLNAVLRNINEKKIADIKRRKDASEGIETVIDKLNKGIPLNPSDQAKIEGAGMKTKLDAFEGFKPKIIQGGKMSGIEAMKEANLLIARKGKYKNISESDAKTKLNELQEIINKANAEPDLGTKLKNFDGDPDAMAGGGLAGALAKLKKKFGKDVVQKGKAPKDKGDKKKTRKMFEDFNKRIDKAGGGLAYMLGEPRQAKSGGGVISKFLKALSAKSPAQRYKDYLESVKKRSIEGDFKSLAPELGAVSAGGILINRKMKKILEEGNELQKERFLKEYIEELNNDPSYDDRPELKDKLIENYTESLFGEKRADGGRIGFADGGMSRRTFLKIMAALAAFPVVGKLTKTAKVAKGAAPLVTKTSEMPEHFPKLVEKIIREGQVVDSQFIKKTGNVKTYRHPERADIELTIEGEGDRIQLDFETDQGMRGGYEFKKGSPDESVPNPPDEFIDGEVKYRMSPDGDYTKDFEFGIDTGTENLDEFVGIKKQKTSKSKVNLPDSTDDFADGGLAGLLGE